jgi:hypothetical protein
MPSSNRWPVLLAALLGLSGCMTVQPTAFPIGPPRMPKQADTVVELFQDSAPTRKFEPVARLNVHIEKTFFVPTAFAEALPKLEALAREHGADALMTIEEKKSRLNETFIYNVSATAIAFTDLADVSP